MPAVLTRQRLTHLGGHNRGLALPFRPLPGGGAGRFTLGLPDARFLTAPYELLRVNGCMSLQPFLDGLAAGSVIEAGQFLADLGRDPGTVGAADVEQFGAVLAPPPQQHIAEHARLIPGLVEGEGTRGGSIGRTEGVHAAGGRVPVCGEGRTAGDHLLPEPVHVGPVRFQQLVTERQGAGPITVITEELPARSLPSPLGRAARRGQAALTSFMYFVQSQFGPGSVWSVPGTSTWPMMCVRVFGMP